MSSSGFFPTDPKQLRQRIKSYERKFRQEKKARGDYDDGYGKRFLLGPLYMLAGDLQGALAHYEWYEKAFPDDCPEPYNQLTWALALHRAGRDQEAFRKLYQAMLANLYLVPYLLGETPQKLDIWHGSNHQWLEYALSIPKELLALWDQDALAWARKVYDDPAAAEHRGKYIEVHRKLETEHRLPERSRLVDESARLEDIFDG